MRYPFLVLFLLVYGSCLTKSIAEDFITKDSLPPLSDGAFQRQHLETYAKESYQNQQYQEAYWTYQLLGHPQIADQIYFQLENILQRAEFKVIKAINEQQGIYRVQFVGTKILATFQASPGVPAKYRALAYQLSHRLNLNIVPMTFLRNDPQLGRGSIQYHIASLKTAKQISTENPSFFDFSLQKIFKNKKYPPVLKKMWVLDYLMGQNSRTENSWGLRQGGFPVAHINEYSDPNSFAHLLVLSNESQLPDQKLLKLLQELNTDSFYFNGNTPHVPLRHLNALFANINRLIDQTNQRNQHAAVSRLLCHDHIPQKK